MRKSAQSQGAYSADLANVLPDVGESDLAVLVDAKGAVEEVLATPGPRAAAPLEGRPFVESLPTEARRPLADALAASLCGSARSVRFGKASWPTGEYEARISQAGERSLITVRRLEATVRQGQDSSRLQELVQHVAAEWRLTFDAVHSPILLIDDELRVLRLNQAAQSLAGRGFHDCIGQRLEDLGGRAPWRRAAQLAAESLKSRQQWSSHRKCVEGERSWELWINPVRKPDLVEELVVVVLQDTTEEEQLQESLRKSEVMSVMGALVGGVAHEVRNPLFALSAALDAFEARFGQRQEFTAYLELLRQQLDRLNKLMRELLEYGKPVERVLSPRCLEEVVREAILLCEPVQEEMAVQIRSQLEQRTLVDLDPDRLVQVFANLLENALQHAPATTSVEVDVETATDKGIVVVTISDRGPGFRPEDIGRIFEPFFTRRRGGTGLGLSIVQRIVEDHSGRIQAQNREGGGARMVVTLPLSEGPTEHEGA